MILVTGASGFLGRHLVQALSLRFPDRPLRLFDVRPSTDALPTAAEFVSGEIEDAAAVSVAMQGVTAVVHLAAKVHPNSREVDALTRVNVDGARTVYAAAVEASVPFFLHMSSAGIYGHPRGPNSFLESDEKKPESPYQVTKYAAEQALLSLDGKRTTLNILRPAGIYGAGSHLELPAYKRIRDRRWVIEMRGGVIVHPTHVSDVIGAIVAMIERPAHHGAVFNVGGEQPILLQEFEAVVARALGVARRRVVFPPGLASPLTAALSPVFSALGRPKPRLRSFGRGDFVSCAANDQAFRAEYPEVPVHPLRAGVEDHVRWARSNDLL
jgi:nucleoside-diphosphate-sugar epimerase